MQGKIIKGIAGFYYVHVVESGIYECKAKGIFRKEKKKPLVGDSVIIDILDEDNKKGNINEIMMRKNELIRPAVANVDQALVVFSIKKPKPHFNLLDRFLIMMEAKGIETILCFNKSDLAGEEEYKKIEKIYEKCNYQLIFVSATKETGLDKLKNILLERTTVIAGPSGVGKSSIINRLQKSISMETGSISEKIERGKHTTRHSELIPINEVSYIMDTPGFSSLYTNEFEKEKLKYYFREFEPFEGKCKFNGCDHVHEPECKVKKAVEEGVIHNVRYENYLKIYKELQERRRY